MTKRHLLLLAILISCATIKAQEHLLLRVGGGLTGISHNDTKTVGTFMVGIGYEHELSQKWSISPSLLYFSKGWKFNDETVAKLDQAGAPMLDPETNQPLYAKKGVKSNANYLQLPILLNYYIRLESPHYISLSAGPYAAIGVGGKTEIRGDQLRQDPERLYYEQNTFGSDGVRRFDTGLSLAVGYEYDRHINLSLNADLGLLKTLESGGRNHSCYLSFMYRF